ncbi:hypothetical protein [Streptomyces sp. NPDC048357]|uniref:hypothetical protein n=1 Tax=Streptomyces sp. NPDC048357 TaxID=3154719 RepID=UPI0034336B52
MPYTDTICRSESARSQGGYGTPDDDDFAVEWHDHADSRRAPGYAQTARQLEIRLRHCHRTNRPPVTEQLAAARAGEGPTVFDWLIEIFEDQVPAGMGRRASRARAGSGAFGCSATCVWGPVVGSDSLGLI